MSRDWTTEPHECKDGKWPCPIHCECPKVEFSEKPELWITLHCKAMQKMNGGNITERVVNFIKRYQVKAKLPDLDFSKFPQSAKSPALERLLQRRKVA